MNCKLEYSKMEEYVQPEEPGSEDKTANQITVEFHDGSGATEVW